MRVFYWKILEHYQSEISIQLHQNANVTQCFTLLLSDDIKQNSDTTTAYIKRLIAVIKDKKILTASLIAIWENNYSFAEQYICASVLYPMSVMSNYYSVIIYQGISATGHGKEVVNGINSIDTLYIYQLMYIVQIPGSNRFDSQIHMHTG